MKRKTLLVLISVVCLILAYAVPSAIANNGKSDYSKVHGMTLPAGTTIVNGDIEGVVLEQSNGNFFVVNVEHMNENEKVFATLSTGIEYEITIEKHGNGNANGKGQNEFWVKDCKEIIDEPTVEPEPDEPDEPSTPTDTPEEPGVDEEPDDPAPPTVTPTPTPTQPNEEDVDEPTEEPNEDIEEPTDDNADDSIDGDMHGDNDGIDGDSMGNPSQEDETSAVPGVKTGDASNLVGWLIALCLAGIVLVICIEYYRKED